MQPNQAVVLPCWAGQVTKTAPFLFAGHAQYLEWANSMIATHRQGNTDQASVRFCHDLRDYRADKEEVVKTRSLYATSYFSDWLHLPTTKKRATSRIW